MLTTEPTELTEGERDPLTRKVIGCTDIIVENSLLLELKAVEQISRLHEAQILTYLKLTQIPTGLILNFNTRVLKDGIKRFKS